MFRREGYFHVNKRDKRPKIMDDPELGSHHFIQHSVRMVTNISFKDINLQSLSKPKLSLFRSLLM